MIFTPEQKKVIDSAKGNILVTAAAGSGKTSVMVERITQRIMRGEAEVRQILVMTFTEAAASNMKAKISSSLQDALRRAANPEDRTRLGRQMIELPYARISTIHSFCLQVVREFAYLLEEETDGMAPVPSDVRVADEAEQRELFTQAIGEVMNEAYLQLAARDKHAQEEDDVGEETLSPLTAEEQAQADDFINLLDSFSGSKTDEGLRDQIRQIYSFLRSMPDYEVWAQREVQNVEAASRNFDSSPAARKLKQRLGTSLDAVEADLEEAWQLAEDADTVFHKDPGRNAEYLDACREYVTALNRLQAALASDPDLPWDTIWEAGLRIQPPALRRGGKNENKARLIDLIKINLAEAQYMLNGIQSSDYKPRGTRPLFRQPITEIEDDLSAMLPAIRSLFRTVLKVDRRYAELKAERTVIDFNDFEHIALKLLRKDDVIRHYRRQISEVYVDEYQDTSSIQNTIIEAVSQGNVFAVGDVKQSIYRFRHARPELFLKKSQEYLDSPDRGILLELSMNFRSVKGILDAVNSVFSRVMEQESGEINYSDGQQLNHHHEPNPAIAHPVEFILIDNLPADSPVSAAPASGRSPQLDDVSESPAERGSTDDEDEMSAQEVSSIQNQALVIADSIIRQRYGSGSKAVENYKDIAVLCLTNAHARAVSEVLLQQGLPVSGDEEKGFLESAELRLMEALMRLLNNEQQDLPLLTVLRQLPVFGRFSDADLMEIKAYRLRMVSELPRNEHYHVSFRYYAENGPDNDLRTRLRRLREWVRVLRDKAVYLSLEELLQLIYLETSLPEFVSAEENGDERARNLRMFQEWASGYEGKGRRGLSYFSAYLLEKRRQGEERSPFSEEQNQENAVRVITFHRSKGLEYKVIYLTGLEKKLIRSSGQGSAIQLSEGSGIGFQVRRPDRLLAYPSMLQLGMQQELRDQAFAESLRLLYVAMTRAEQKLYMLAAVPRGLANKDPSSSSFRRKLDSWMKAGLADVQSGLPAGKTAVYDRSILQTAETYADLIMMSQLAEDPSLYDFFAEASGGSSVTGGPWRHSAIYTGEFWEPEESEETASAAAAPDVPETAAAVTLVLDQDLYNDICRSYSTVYPYERSTHTPQKFAVSELKRRMQRGMLLNSESVELEASDAQDGVLLPSLAGAGINTQIEDWLSRPADRAVRGQSIRTALSPSERGTALHTALRFLDIAGLRGSSRDAVEDALAELRRETVLSEDELDAVLPYAEKLLAYADSDIAGRLLEAEKNGGGVYKEIPFTLALKARSVLPEDESMDGDQVLVQGIIDLWFAADGESVLLDYKSDVLKGSYEERLKTLEERYSLQLKLYAQAITAATGKAVRETLIWSIPDARVYSLSPG